MENVPTNPFKVLESAHAILWDFDGVLLDSMPVRDRAFRNVLREYPNDLIDELVKWHLDNGGLSRYVKFRRFQTEILGQNSNEDQIQTWAAEFSRFCQSRLVDKKLLIEATTELLPSLSERLPMHIVSGSDGDELRGLCRGLGLAEFFLSIEGSPTPKTKLVYDILNRYKYSSDKVWLIGDSRNDYEAAQSNDLNFMGFGNAELKPLSNYYWEREG